MRRLSIALSFAAAALAAASALSAGLPGVGADDRREPVDVGSAPWRSVVKVQSGGGQRCTGALISADTVLTAAHCLWNPRTRRLLPPSSHHVLFGYERGDFAEHRVVTAYRTVPEWHGPDGSPPGLASDWALLTLSAPAITRVPPLPLAAHVPVPGQSLKLGGFNRDRGHLLIADQNCRVTGELRLNPATHLLRHDCEGTLGTSGAPVLAEGPGGWEIVGVNVAVTSEGSLAVPSVLIMDALTNGERNPD